jgi:hypothetical protein
VNFVGRSSQNLFLTYCLFLLSQYGWWYARDGNETSLGIAADLALSTFTMAGTAFAPGEPARDMLSEMSSTPFSEAAEALRIILSRKSKYFVSHEAMSALGGEFQTECSQLFNFPNLTMIWFNCRRLGIFVRSEQQSRSTVRRGPNCCCNWYMPCFCIAPPAVPCEVLSCIMFANFELPGFHA